MDRVRPGVAAARGLPAGRSDDGRSFGVLSEGLPPCQAYDPVYRHALDVGADGSLLAMGSTTDALWVGYESGAVWRAIDVRLPPVYAVRFA